jgi:hypothetical protein
MNKLTTVLAENLGDLAAESRIFEQKTTDVFSPHMLHDHKAPVWRFNFRQYNFPQRTDLAIRSGIVAAVSPEPCGRPAGHIRTGHKGMIPQFHFLASARVRIIARNVIIR